MLIKKVIETGIDVQNPINVYSDPDNIKNILAEKYEGRCFRGCYIKSVDRVIRQSDCIINQDGEPGYGTISVIFEVTAVVYANGEIINGCLVRNKDQSGLIICETDIASIILNSHKSLESIQKDQYISVRVGVARYDLSAKKISISAMPFLPQRAPVFKPTGVIEQPDLFANVLSRIDFEEAEMARLRTEKTKAWDTFNHLLYPWKEEQKPPSGVSVINIVEFARSLSKGSTLPAAYLSRDSRINGSQPTVYGWSSEPPEAKISTFPAEYVLLSLLEDYCAYLRTIREMIGVYSTPELISKHNNLWLIFKKNKF